MWTWTLGIVGFLFLLGNEVSGQEQSKLTKYFASKCHTYSANGQVYDNLRVNVEELKTYTKYVFSYLPKNKVHFCKTERPFMIGRMKAVADNLGQCLPTEEQFLPQFFQDLFENFLRFLCVNDGQHMESFFSSQGEECRNQLSVEEVTSCFGRIFAPTSNVVKKTDMCDDLDVAKKCFTQILDQKCPNFRAFEELNNNLFRYLKKPCSLSSSSGAASVALPTMLLFLGLLMI